MEERYKIVYCTLSLYIAGGVKRALTMKANYFADVYGYNITIILTDGKGKPHFYLLSDKGKVINIVIDFDELWRYIFFGQILPNLRKQRIFKKKQTAEMMRIRPDVTVCLLRREINFLTKIKDGSKKIGELHVNKLNFRTFKDIDTNFFKKLFSKYWVAITIPSLKRLDKFVVLTNEDKAAWTELYNVVSIPNPISFEVDTISKLKRKRVIAVGRYDYVKVYDRLLKARRIVEDECPDWHLDVYGKDDQKECIEDAANSLGMNIHVYPPTNSIFDCYRNSSILVSTSLYEPFGLVIPEVISCGLPTIAYDCLYGPASVIEDGINGFLMKMDDREMMIRKIIMLMNDLCLRRKMGEVAYKSSSSYSAVLIMLLWKNLFYSLLTKKTV